MGNRARLVDGPGQQGEETRGRVLRGRSHTWERPTADLTLLRPQLQTAAPFTSVRFVHIRRGPRSWRGFSLGGTDFGPRIRASERHPAQLAHRPRSRPPTMNATATAWSPPTTHYPCPRRAIRSLSDQEADHRGRVGGGRPGSRRLRHHGRSRTAKFAFAQYRIEAHLFLQPPGRNLGWRMLDCTRTSAPSTRRPVRQQTCSATHSSTPSIELLSPSNA
jgi:hypothetical protein